MIAVIIAIGVFMVLLLAGFIDMSALYKREQQSDNQEGSHEDGQKDCVPWYKF